MNNRGTIRDVTEWAERCLPGNESHARSAIVTVRKGGLFTYGKNGPRGKGAAVMKVTDFATAILAIMHDGPATKSDEVVPMLWGMNLTSMEIDDPERGGPFNRELREWDPEIAQPYLDRFNLQLPLGSTATARSNLIAVLTQLFSSFATMRDFNAADEIIYESCGADVAVKIKLHGGNRVTNEGWTGSGPDHSTVTLTFGADIPLLSRGIKTTRVIGAKALDELASMAPTYTRGNAQ
jgi:hypothetical protein